jgi:predicted transcriptional regulator of viral defense system
MLDVLIAELAGRQFNRISRQQLMDLGVSKTVIQRRVAAGRLVIVGEGVFAIAPVLEHDNWGRWMGATLTAPETSLCRESAACAFGALEFERLGVTVTRPGSGGPRRMSGVTVFRSSTLGDETTNYNGVPITTVPRTLLDLACCVSERPLARALREFVRLKATTIYSLSDWLGPRTHRRRASRLAKAMAQYRGLPIERARSGAEVRALEILRDAGVELPRLNVDVADEEADLSWPRERFIIEIDGGPYHQDAGEDARKEAAWRAAGWEVVRIDSHHVYENPHKLLNQAAKGRNVRR